MLRDLRTTLHAHDGLEQHSRWNHDGVMTSLANTKSASISSIYNKQCTVQQKINSASHRNPNCCSENPPIWERILGTKMEYFPEMSSAIRSSISHGDLVSTKTSPVDEFPEFQAYLDPFRQRGSTMPSSIHREKLGGAGLTAPSTSRDSDSSDLEFEPAEYYRVRSYSVTGKGVKKCGEALRMRVTSGQQHVSLCSVSSSGSSTTSLSRLRSWSHGSTSSERSVTSEGSSTTHRVAVLGAPEVGKRSLVAQFVTFDWDGSAGRVDLDDMTNNENFEEDEISVSVLLDGDESKVCFHNLNSSADISPKEFVFRLDLDAYVIVYSVSDRNSFNTALRLLSLLQASDLLVENAVILVGNKVDLERSRNVTTEEGREAATSCGCKFIETSEWISHNVDELLVGILSQIRLKRRQRSEVKPAGYSSRSSLLRNNGTEKKAGTRRSRSVVRDLFRKINFNSRSCDNLHVL